VQRFRRSRRMAIPLSLLAAVAGMLMAGPVGPAAAASRKGSAAISCNTAALAKTTAPVQLTFWESMPKANGTTLTTLTNAFNTSQDHVHVNLVYQDGADATWTKVQAGLTTGQLPNLAQLQDVNLQGAADSGAFVPVQGCISATHYSTSDFVPRILDYWKIKGVQIGMPFDVSVPVVYYNENSFTKAGLNPSDPPATLPAYLADAKALKASGSGTGLVLDSWHLETWLATANQLFVNHDNGRSGRATKALFNTKYGRAIFSELDSLVRSGDAVTSPSSGPQAFDNLIGIGTGKYGMTIDTSADLGTIETLLPSYPNVKLGVGAFPILSSSSKGGIEPGGDALYIAAKDSPVQRAAAWEYIRYLDSTSSQATWAAGTGYVPIRVSATKTLTVRNLWAKTPGYKVAYTELTTGVQSPATAGSAIGPYTQVRQDEASAEESMYTQGVSPAKAISKLATQVNQTLAAYNSRL